MNYPKLFILSMLLTSSFLVAEDERPPLNDAPVTVQEYFTICESKAAQMEANEGMVTQGLNPNHTSHNSSRHIFDGATQYFDQVRLRDGSIWAVRPEDRRYIDDWYLGDSLAVTQADRSWWDFRTDKFIYALYNERTHQTIEVQLSGCPLPESFYRRYIEYIYKGHDNAYLILNDKSVWVLDEGDRMIWDKWLPLHSIIIGTNNKWFSWNRPNILINCATSWAPIESICKN